MADAMGILSANVVIENVQEAVPDPKTLTALQVSEVFLSYHFVHCGILLQEIFKYVLDFYYIAYSM